MCKMQCVNRSASRTSRTDQLEGQAGRTSWTDKLDRPARQTSWTDQLDRSAGRTRLTNQLDRPVHLYEALASSHIIRISFQFVHCRIFRVRRRPCLFLFGDDTTITWFYGLSPLNLGFSSGWFSQKGYLAIPGLINKAIMWNSNFIYKRVWRVSLLCRRVFFAVTKLY